MFLQQKIEQMYKALAEMRLPERLAEIKPHTVGVGNQSHTSFDFTKATDSATAANRVSTLLASIACLKDYLKEWCKRNNVAFAGDQLIDSNRDVAVVHDLWNRDKHGGELQRSRSGLFPKIDGQPKTSLVLGGGTAQAMVTFPLCKGGVAQAIGDAGLRVCASVVDKDGKHIGDLEMICEKAISAWQAEFIKAGLRLRPAPEQQQQYLKLSSRLQAIGLAHRSELPIGATSLLMKVHNRKVVVEVYDRMGKQIGTVPNDKTSAELKSALQNAFEHSISPDPGGVAAILS